VAAHKFWTVIVFQYFMQTVPDISTSVDANFFCSFSPFRGLSFARNSPKHFLIHSAETRKYQPFLARRYSGADNLSATQAEYFFFLIYASSFKQMFSVFGYRRKFHLNQF